MRPATPRSECRSVAICYAILAVVPAISIFLLLVMSIDSLEQLRRDWPLTRPVIQPLALDACLLAAMSWATFGFYRRSTRIRAIVLGASFLLFVLAMANAALVARAAIGSWDSPVDPSKAIAAKSLLALGYGLLLWMLFRVHRRNSDGTEANRNR